MNNELIEKLKACTTAEELVALMKAEGKEITLEQAEQVLTKLKNAPLSDDALDDVSGGSISGIVGHVVKEAFGVAVDEVKSWFD